MEPLGGECERMGTVHIYIDESGSFIPLDDAKSKASAVAALVVPSPRRAEFVRAFRKLRRKLRPGVVEMKGSSVSEVEAAQFFDLFRHFDVIVEAVVTDAGRLGRDDVSKFKEQQGHKLLEHITREHHPSLIEELLQLQATINTTANQLFVQAFCTIQLVARLLETATMYYSQRLPRELGAFHWRCDAKGKRVTAFEDMWTKLILPVIQTQTGSQPSGMIPGGDYSYYDRFNLPPESGQQLPDGHYRTDLMGVLNEDFQFADSRNDLGIQAVDVIVSTLTRALNGSLRRPGWLGLGDLLVGRRERTIQIVSLSPYPGKAGREPITNEHWIKVITDLQARGKPMLTAAVAHSLGESDGC